MTVNYRGDIVRANTTLGLGGVDISQWPLLDEDVAAIRANLIFSLFYTMSLVAQAQFDLDDAVVDAYQDESGIDTGACIDQYYNSTGKFYINQTPVSATNEANAINNTDLTTYTFSSQAFGAAHVSRIVAVLVASVKSGGGQTVSSMTIGGVSAAFAAGQTNGEDRLELWWAAVPTGTSGDVAVTWSAGVACCSCSCYRVLYANSTMKDSLAVAANPSIGTLEVVAGGAVIAATQNKNTSSNIIWVSGVNEDNEQAMDFCRVSVGNAETVADNAAYAVESDIAIVSSTTMVAGSWEKGVLDMTLQSEAFTADSVPTEAYLLVFVNDFTSPAYNTDFKGYVSRDGGTTWTQVTLTAEAAGFPGQKFVQGTEDISAQPSGTSMLYKITTHNGHVFLINGASLFWK